MADVNTGASGTLRISAWESSYNAAANTSVVSWELWLIERVASNQTHVGSGVAASVAVGGTPVWSGSFGFSWTASGLQSTLIASGSTPVGHSPDGSGYVEVAGAIGATGTTGAGGPTSVAQGVGLTTLKVVPGTPTAVAGTRNSDTQVAVSWAQSSASNGQPTSNTVRQSVNGGAWANVAAFAPASSVLVTAAPNQKIVYGVIASNAAGNSAWSGNSAPVFTTPAAPSDVVASKNDSLDIVVSFTPHVAFVEHQHVIVHGTVAGGVTTWDAAPLVSLPAGTTTYTHAAPSASAQHVYKVCAKNINAAALASADVVSNTVQLLTAPNKPTLPGLASNVDKAKAFVLSWTHNPVDTTPQSAYEVGYSTNGGTAWSTTGKVTATTPSKSFPANTYASGQQLTVRVRTWGQAATGGADGTGASPWSDLATVTFKTRPVVTILSPQHAGEYEQSTLEVGLSFAQVEGATFVGATIELYQGALLLEQMISTTLSSTIMGVRVANGGAYEVRVVVRDSNGLASDLRSASFDVVYTEPVAAEVTTTYLSDSGIGQIDLVIPAPGPGEAAAVTVSITRRIGGVSESVVDRFPVSPAVSILDMTPTIYGENEYTVTTVSADGATTDVVHVLETAEDEWAFMSTGPGFEKIIRFGGQLKPQSTPSVDAALVKTAGRSRPIGLYGTTGGLVVSGTGEVVTGLGSSAEDIEAFLLMPGKGCYRDPTGRRMFGLITGQVSRDAFMLGSFTYSVTETS